jgi:hypothetical protein
VISLTFCTNNISTNSYIISGSDTEVAEVSFEESRSTSIMAYSHGSTLLEITDEYRMYLMNLEIETMALKYPGNPDLKTLRRYLYTIKVPLEMEITYPYIHMFNEESNKVADVVECMKLPEGKNFIDYFEIEEDNFYVQEGYFTQIDIGTYEGVLGNMIHFSVLEYGEGRNYKYSYGFLIELENDIAAHVTFYSTNENRTEAEVYYRSIVETIQKA